MQYACDKVAQATLELKRRYRAILSASPAYGSDRRMTMEIDALGSALKELEDAVIVLQIKLDNSQEPLVAFPIADSICDSPSSGYQQASTPMALS